jgi:hypothetical protein
MSALIKSTLRLSMSKIIMKMDSYVQRNLNFSRQESIIVAIKGLGEPELRKQIWMN